MGKPVGDDDYTDTLFASLPNSYDSAIQSISTSACLSSTKLMADIFEQLIIDKYECHNIKDKCGKTKDNKDKALTADSKGGREKDKCKVECFNCKKKGHYKLDCWAKGRGKEGQGPKQGKGTKEDATPAEEKEETEAWATIKDVPEPTDKAWFNAAAAAVGSTPMQVAQAHSDTATKLYNSGASHHMSPFRDRFKSYREIPPHAIAAADKRVFHAIGTGDLEIEVPNGKSSTSILLKDVLHAPKMGTTIVSVNRIAKAGYAVTFKDNTCQIRNKSNKVIGMIPASQNGLYKVERVCAAATPEEHIDLVMLHQCLAHIGPNAIWKMVKSNVIEGIELVDDGSTLICEACEQAKAMCKQICKECEAPLVDTFGAEVHTDLWGPSPVPSLGGRAYYVTFNMITPALQS
jgi:hypothetical protein